MARLRGIEKQHLTVYLPVGMRDRVDLRVERDQKKNPVRNLGRSDWIAEAIEAALKKN